MILAGNDEVREQKSVPGPLFPPQMAQDMGCNQELRDEKPPNKKLTGSQRRIPGNFNTKLNFVFHPEVLVKQYMD